MYDVDTNPTIRTKIKNPINFASFLTSLVDIQRASQAGGVYLNDTHRGRVGADVPVGRHLHRPSAATQSGSNNVGAVTPICGAAVDLQRALERRDLLAADGDRLRARSTVA